MVESISISVELLEQFERGNVLLFVGEGINRGILPSSAELAEELAARCDYPPEEPLTLPRVAGYYELTRDRHGLIQFLRDRLDSPALAPLRAHILTAQLRPRVIVTTCYDRLLERALQEAGIPYTPVVGNAEVAYAEERKVLLVWLWGALDQPDSIVVTEDDRRLFLESRANLSDVLRAELARRTWLFVGFDAEDEWFRGFYDSVSRGLDRHRQRAYIVGTTPGAYTHAWWKKRNAEILSADVEPFLAALTDQLAARAGPEIPAPRPVIVPAEPLPLPEEPYKALVSYEAKDRAMFFGRDCETEGLTALVHAHRLVLLYGASGVGKTSLLQAGVIPRLGETEPGYTVVTVRALTDPVTALRAALRRQLPDVELPDDDTPLVGFLTTATRISDRALVLVIDQFEEFFVRLSPEFRAEFIAELGTLYDARDLPVKVVLSLREDYLASVSELEHRIPEVFHTRMRLLPLTHEQARDAIVCPVEALGYSYEPVLVERLLDDLEREGVMPPQLQLVCNALFRRAHAEGRKALTVADYEALGGVQGVLRGYLDEELRRFPAEEQALARDLLEELVTSERTKKVETLDELAVALVAEPAVLSSVAEKLVQARLLRPLDSGGTSEHAYELSHEYLIDEIILTAEVIARKEAEELLDHEVLNWRRHSTLMDTKRVWLVLEKVGIARLEPEEAELLLRSALQHDWGSRSLWTSLWKVTCSERLLTDLLSFDTPLAVRARKWAVRMGARCSAEEALLGALVHTAYADDSIKVRVMALDSLNEQTGHVFESFIKHSGIQPIRKLTEVGKAISRLVSEEGISSTASWRVGHTLGVWAANQAWKGNLHLMSAECPWHLWPIFLGAFLFRFFELATQNPGSAIVVLPGSIYASLVFLAWSLVDALRLQGPTSNALGVALGIVASLFALLTYVRPFDKAPPKKGSLSRISLLVNEIWERQQGGTVLLLLYALCGALLGTPLSLSLEVVLGSVKLWLIAAVDTIGSDFATSSETMTPASFVVLGIIVLLLGWLVLRILVSVAKITLSAVSRLLVVLVEAMLVLLGLLWSPILLVSAGLCLPLRIEQPRECLHLRMLILAPFLVPFGLAWMLFPGLSRLRDWPILLVWSLLFSLILYVSKSRGRHIAPALRVGIGFSLGVLLVWTVTANLGRSLLFGLVTGGLAMGVQEAEGM